MLAGSLRGRPYQTPIRAVKAGELPGLLRRGGVLHPCARRLLPSRRPGVGSSCLWALLGLLILAPLAYAQDAARVTRVVDGDTILLEDGRRVRYLGINTPEFGEPYSRRAREFNAGLVRGRAVRLEFDQEPADPYGRLLAYVHVGTDMANARLVQEGLAHAFFIGPARKYNELLLRFQDEARAQHLGIWSSRGRTKELKITSIHPRDPAAPGPQEAYLRIASLSSARLSLAGYSLEDETGRSYRFPAVSLDPGYTVVLRCAEGTDGLDSHGQLVVHWGTAPVVWPAAGGIASLRSPDGRLVDSIRYRERHGNGGPPRGS